MVGGQKKTPARGRARPGRKNRCATAAGTPNIAADKPVVDYALWWAEAGIPVFPTGEDKRPLTKNGHRDASLDPDEIIRMFENPRAHGIGGRMGKIAGVFAIDADLYKPGEAGESAKRYVERLQAAKLLPETRTHKTRNGGVHFLLKSDSEWPNVNPVSGVEVKGEGGYIILPGSPGYEVVREGIAEAPPALIQELKAARSQQSGRSIDALKSAILRGDDFHDPLTQIAAKMAADGRSIDQVQADILSTMSASAAILPTHPRHDRWRAIMENKSGELSRIVESANRKFNPNVASDALREAAGTMFADSAPSPWSEEESRPVVPSVADYAADGAFPFAGSRGYFASEPLNLQSQNFVMHPILSENEVTLISAAPKAGKTLVSETLALHIATGRDFGVLTVKAPRPVVYFALESQTAIRRRLEAWCQFHDRDGVAGLRANTKMYVYEGGLNLLNETARQDLANKLKATDLWYQARGESDVGVIVIDTLTKAMPGGDQNSVEDTSAVFDIIAKIREAGSRAAVIIIHHNSKATDSPRGSGNIQAEPDTLLTVKKEDRTGLLRLIVTNARSIDEGSFTFAIHTEQLGENDQGHPITAPVLTPASVGSTPAKPLTKVQKLAVQAFHAASSAEASDGSGVSKEQWRQAFYKIRAGANADAKKKSFYLALKELRAAGVLIDDGEYCRLTGEHARPDDAAFTRLSRPKSPPSSPE